MVSPYINLREQFKSKYPVIEIYLVSNRKGKENFKVNEYEPPISNFLQINTDLYTVEECISKIKSIYFNMSCTSCKEKKDIYGEH